MLKKINIKLATIFLVVVSVIALIIGSTLAYWIWSSNNLVTVNITTNMGGIGLTLNGGTHTINNLAPASCTHSTYANQLPVVISRYNETQYLATTILTLKLTSFTWEHAKPSVDDLSNIKFAVTSSNSSCINPLASGDLASITTNNTASTAESQNTIVFNWEYILPANSGTQSNSTNETYYLYVWIDPDYTFENTGSNQIQDPLQDISLTVTWSATNIEQTDTLKTKLYDHIRDNADTATTIDFSNSSEEDNTLGIYRLASTASDTYPVYYYRGAVTNNNVYFANKCWKIIRTTSTGGVKLIYNGLNTGTSETPACNNTGTDSQIGTSVFHLNKSTPALVGYMYGNYYSTGNSVNANGWKYAPDVTYQNGMYTLVSKEIDNVTYNVEVKNDISGNNLNYQHYTCGSASDVSCSEVKYVYNGFDISGTYRVYYMTLTDGVEIEEALQEMLTNSSNTTDSAAKTAVDTWYASNMINYTSYLEDTPYCSDRSIYSLGGFNPEGGHVDGVMSDVCLNFISTRGSNPIISCNKNDSFTVNESTIGNGKLTYPVGLITVDEIVMAGRYSDVSYHTYLFSGQNYWTMTPHSFYLRNAAGMVLDSIGSMNSDVVNHSNGVRPVLSLKPGTRIESGAGTVADPFIID